MSIIGATVTKPVKIKTQLFAIFGLGDWKGQFVFIIVPKLNKDCIIGVDMLKQFQSKIDFKNNIVELKYENEYVKINLMEDAPKEIRIIFDPDCTNQINCIQCIG